jgi:hypothetical protein
LCPNATWWGGNILGKDTKCRNKNSESEYNTEEQCFESEKETEKQTLLIKAQRAETNIYAQFLVSLT